MVNIKDFLLKGSSKKIIQNRLVVIFEIQKKLEEKYLKIEEKNGLLQTSDIPVNIHDVKGQARLKDFAWRITEELGEALEAFEKHPYIKDHYNEEIADALHFLTGFTILAGVSPENLVKDLVYEDPKDNLNTLYNCANADLSENYFTKDRRNYENLTYFTGKVIEKLAVTCNTLKQKPWKQTHMLTDVNLFNRNLMFTWIAFIELCIVAKIDSERLFKLYLGKSMVNKFRIRSQY